VLIVWPPVLASISGSITISRGSGPSVAWASRKSWRPARVTASSNLIGAGATNSVCAVAGAGVAVAGAGRALVVVVVGVGVGVGVGAGAGAAAGVGAVAGAPDVWQPESRATETKAAGRALRMRRGFIVGSWWKTRDRKGQRRCGRCGGQRLS
jgi:hypothetical protein